MSVIFSVCASADGSWRVRRILRWERWYAFVRLLICTILSYREHKDDQSCSHFRFLLTFGHVPRTRVCKRLSQDRFQGIYSASFCSLVGRYDNLFVVPAPRVRICKRLWSPGIDSEESTPTSDVAWRAGTKKGLSYRHARMGIDSGAL